MIIGLALGVKKNGLKARQKMSDKRFNNKNLKQAIDNSRMTREQIADKVQCDTSTITKYYNGDRCPKADVIIKLAKLFNVSTDYLLGITRTATTDKDMRFICDYTGLDEKTVKILNTLKENDKYINSVMLYIKQLKNIWRVNNE